MILIIWLLYAIVYCNLIQFTSTNRNKDWFFISFFNFFLQAGISGGHILIAVNRTWAVLHPISYRSIHSKRVAVLLCAGMWCYIHVVLLPGIIRDALYFRMDMASNSCYLDSAAQRSWAIAVQVVIFNNPQLIMLTSLSIVVIMRYIRAGKKLSRRVEPTSIPG